jgi:proteasome lid subunit RPN8/RPN11
MSGLRRRVTDGLALPAVAVEAILAHARAELPNEACGILAASAAGRVTRYHPARNALASRYAYEVDGGDLVRITYAIEADGEVLAGIVHSHPATPAVPSARDIREAAYRVVHLLVGLADPGRPALRGWRLEADGAREVTVELEPAQQLPTDTWSVISPRAASRTRSIPHEPSSPPER